MFLYVGVVACSLFTCFSAAFFQSAHFELFNLCCRYSGNTNSEQAGKLETGADYHIYFHVYFRVLLGDEAFEPSSPVSSSLP